MFKSKRKFLYFFLLFFSCTSGTYDEQQEKREDNKETITQEFLNYWYMGNAEVNLYELEQARYGNIHKGHSVLIFVTEDFSRSRQVKVNAVESDDLTKVMKLNFTKKFTTGMYPYSMMASAFSPVIGKNSWYPLKVNASVQEWCGQVFTQANLKNGEYRVQGYSYFASEGDTTYKLNKTYIEEGLWNLIRINPEELPMGKITVLPSMLYCRLSHKPLKPAVANATISSLPGDSVMSYNLNFPDLERTLTINFEVKFPHRITYFEETYDSFGKMLTTKAWKKETKLIDYWNRNSPEDIEFRDRLFHD